MELDELVVDGVEVDDDAVVCMVEADCALFDDEEEDGVIIVGLVLVTVNFKPPPELPCLMANWSPPGKRDFDFAPFKVTLGESAFFDASVFESEAID